jgi:hypothetical protein
VNKGIAIRVEVLARRTISTIIADRGIPFEKKLNIAIADITAKSGVLKRAKRTKRSINTKFNILNQKMFLMNATFTALKRNLKLINPKPIGIMSSSIQFFNPRKTALGNSISILTKSIEALKSKRQTTEAKKFVITELNFLSPGESNLVKTSMFMCLSSLVASEAPMKAIHKTTYLKNGSAHNMPVSNKFLKITCKKLTDNHQRK